MKPTRVLPGAVVVASVAIATMFAAAPASAATLPPGQKITVIDSWDDQYYNVNPADAVSTPVGVPDGIYEYVTGVDVDDEGKGFAVATYWVEEDIELEEEFNAERGPVLNDAQFLDYPDGGWIYKADANAGKLTDGKLVLIDLPGNEDPIADECSAIDYSKGVITAVCYFGYGEEWDAAYIGTVEYGDGDFAILTPFTVLSGETFLYLKAIAVNPVDGTLWAFTAEPFGGASYIITPGVDGSDFQQVQENWGVLGADFDRSGQLWLSVAEFLDAPNLQALNPAVLALATYDFATGQPIVVDFFASEDPYEILFPESITIWGALANTGATISLAPAVAASGILLLGAILAAGALVLRRRDADV